MQIEQIASLDGSICPAKRPGWCIGSPTQSFPARALYSILLFLAASFAAEWTCGQTPQGSDGKSVAGQPLSDGRSTIQATIGQTALDLYCFKPSSFQGERLLIVLHGVNRNADEYRDNSQGLAERFQALVVAPRFDAQRFPSSKYHRGGIVDSQGQATPSEQWTYSMLPAIADYMRLIENRPEMKLWVIGHSAGGQFVARMSAFVEMEVERFVAANPGSHLFATRELPFGYGFGGLPESLSNDDRLRHYLSAPLTIFLGTLDNAPDQYFDDSPEAMQQGPGRLQRGQNCYEQARKLAASKNWHFAWTLIEAPGVGHDHRAMFDNDQCIHALLGESGSIEKK